MYARFKFEDNELDGQYYKVKKFKKMENYKYFCTMVDSELDEWQIPCGIVNFYHIKLRKEITFKEKIIGVFYSPLVLIYKLTKRRFNYIAYKVRHYYIKAEIRHLGVEDE